MERTRSRLVEFTNLDIGTSLERWKYDSNSIEEVAKLNELFRLAEKMKLKMTLEVQKDAILNHDDFTRILPQEAEIYGEEKENSWIFSIPPKLENPGRDPYVLNITNISGEPHLVYYHMYHGAVASFNPSDVISITLQ